MKDRALQLAESQREIESMTGGAVSEVTPSRRDFAQYVATQKQGLAVIARLGRDSGIATGGLTAHAQACDDAEVAALFLETGSAALTTAAMLGIAEATTAPILLDALLLDPRQLYVARAHGADAVLLPARELGAAGLKDLVAVARSLHMAPVIEVVDEADVAVALQIAHVVLALRCVDGDAQLDVMATLRLAALAPQQRALLVLPEVRSTAVAGQFVGHCDAIVLGDVLNHAEDVANTIASFLAL